MRTLSGFLLLGGLVCASHQGYAGGDLVSSNVDSSLRSFAGITLGAEFIRTGHTQTLSLLPPFSNHYTNNTSYQSSSLLGLGLGIERGRTEQLSWQLGLSGYFNTEVSSKGHVWQFALPEFDNFIYDYRIQSKRLMATGKLLGTVKQTIHPYVSGELGAGFNRASSYTETPLIIEAVPMAPFSSRTQTSFAWGVGAGVDVDINAGFRLGVGYQFADLGKASLGISPAQLTQQTLALPHLYSQEVRFHLTAFI
jgi:opacity protein-like surface antigen